MKDARHFPRGRCPHFNHKMVFVIFISGPSGSGKSTVSNLIASNRGYAIIHQDDYFLPNEKKPMIILSSGIEVRNWDSINALDMNKFNEDILRARFDLHVDVVLVEGFCLPSYALKIIPDLHIHLSYIGSEKRDDIMDPINTFWIIQRMIASRKESKPKIKNDEAMVKDIIVPFYLGTVANSNITHIVPTFIGDKRIERGLVVARISDIIEDRIR